MGLPRLRILLPLLLLSILQRPTWAIKKSYVVYLGSHSHGPQIKQSHLDLAEKSHYEFLADYVGGQEAAKESIVYCYTRHINGFAATFEEETAAEIAKNPNVISVFPNNFHPLHTTHSWEFLGLEKNDAVKPGSLWEKAKFGEDVIIGNLDSGVWPESKSFSDEGYGPIPSKWKGGCTDSTPDGVRCNRKLIGAKAFNKAYSTSFWDSIFPSNNTRDEIGHGTHTLSTAGGNFVQNVSVFGFGNGTSKGGAPRARVAAYKVCGKAIVGNGCYDADIMAGFDAAIHDGVDILSCSIGGTKDYFSDGLAIGSYHAVRNGIVVVASAGNDGPTPSTISNKAPWLFTVASSTIDRTFLSYVKLGNNKQLKGQSLSPSSPPFSGKLYPMVTGEAARMNNSSSESALYCNKTSLDPNIVKGKIVVCLVDGGIAFYEMGMTALSAGAVGMILTTKSIELMFFQSHARAPLPTSSLSFKESLKVYEYINSTKTPMAYISPVKTKLGTKPAPLMASYSSQGPNNLTPEILKPDITGPGENIIAAWSPKAPPSHVNGDNSQVSFNVLSGTSMACPHLSGVCALLKKLYPNWSPYAIRSAIMTTAGTRDNVRKPMLNSTNMRATPFSYGAGYVRPNHAMDPGLVYDLTAIDHLNFLCAIGYNETQISLFTETRRVYKCPQPAVRLVDFNYPSIAVPNLVGTMTVTRTLKNVGSPGTYKAKITPPSGVFVSVEPNILTFDSMGQEKTFKLTLKTKRLGYAKDYVFGVLRWTDGRHHVKSQIAVKAASTV